MTRRAIRGGRVLFAVALTMIGLVLLPAAAAMASCASPARSAAARQQSSALPAGVTADWWSAVQREIAAPEHQAGRQMKLPMANSLPTEPSWTAEGNQEEARFGFAVAGAGDVNGDGYADVIVGAFYHTNDQEYEGRVFVYHGSPSGLGLEPAWTAEGGFY
jgi:hypothetical protein